MSCRHDLALGTCKVCYSETGTIEPEGDGDSLDGPGAVDRDGIRLPIPPILNNSKKNHMTRTKHIGSTLDSLLKETGDFEAVTLATSKRLLVLKIQRALKRKRMSKLGFMVAMDIGETTMTRLLDPLEIGRVNLDTLLKVSTTLGINLIDVSFK